MGIFHERLKTLKDETGITQTKIAEDLGLTPQSFSYIMNGREPNYETLCKMAEYFKVTTDYLLGRSDHRTVENAAIGKDLGLWNETIEHLKTHKKDTEIVNYLCKLGYLERFNKFVLEAKKTYLNYSDDLSAASKEFETLSRREYCLEHNAPICDNKNDENYSTDEECKQEADKIFEELLNSIAEKLRFTVWKYTQNMEDFLYDLLYELDDVNYVPTKIKTKGKA